jgi:Tol biopolymer transport system component
MKTCLRDKNRVSRAANNITFRLVALIFVGLGVTGCATSSPAQYPGPTLPRFQASSEPEKREDPDPPPTTSSRWLAYIGPDGNIYITTADRQLTLAATNDATAPPEGQGRSYHRVSWSPDGQLAFAAVTRAGNQARSELYVVEAPGKPARLVAKDDEHFVIYIYWSPVACPGRPACRRLAYLIEEDDGVGLRVVEVEAEQTHNQLVGVGRPFYFSWSADGQHILWHAGGARRHNSDAGMALYHVDDDQIDDLSQAPGSFLSPAWSPQGDEWLAVSDSEGADRLQIFPHGGPTEDNPVQTATLATASDTEMVFAWSPRGDQVAFALRPAEDAPFYGPIHVYDLDTGQSRQVTDDGFRVLGFFWAPRGERIGYLTRLDLPDAVWMQWRVVDPATDQDRGFTAFHPAPLMRFIVHSFNQYAQSDRLWSPDGRYLVYADRDRTLAERVWLVDTWAEKGSDPILVDAGSIGVWSWN